MIGILSYGLGNVRAFESLYRRANVDVRTVESAQDLDGVHGLILPGVGAFDHAMELFEASGLRDPVQEAVLGVDKIPILGVCVGMQILASSSEEGSRPGLNWIPGTVHRLRNAPRTPHLGWNDVSPHADIGLFRGIEAPRFYFLHSYYFLPDSESTTIATACYGESFTCAVLKDNVAGVQFHPEKSHDWGRRLLLNFAASARPC